MKEDTTIDFENKRVLLKDLEEEKTFSITFETIEGLYKEIKMRKGNVIKIKPDDCLECPFCGPISDKFGDTKCKLYDIKMVARAEKKQDFCSIKKIIVIVEEGS